MSRSRENVEARYWCDQCGLDWEVEGRLDAEADFEPYDPDAVNCPDCDLVGDYQELI